MRVFLLERLQNSCEAIFIAKQGGSFCGITDLPFAYRMKRNAEFAKTNEQTFYLFSPSKIDNQTAVCT